MGIWNFSGAIDGQIKLRGYRIELEEIEHVMRSHPSIDNAAVKLIHPDSDAASLASFLVVGDSSARDLLASIRRHAADQLPSLQAAGNVPNRRRFAGWAERKNRSQSAS